MNRRDGWGRETIFGIRPYCPGKPVEELERELGIKSAIKLASNENPLGPSPLAVAAMREYLPRVSVYPDSNCYYLRQELSRHHGCDPDQLIFGNGSDNLLQMIAAAFLNPGEESIIISPTFSAYEFVTRVMDGVPVIVPMTEGYQYDFQAVLQAVGPKTRLLFICNPNNPTGTLAPADELERLLATLPRRVIVVLDEAYFDYVTVPGYQSGLSFLEHYPNLIVARTFSKIYGLAGLRIGYGVASEQVAALVNRVKEPFNVNLMAQVGALAALADQEHYRRSRELVTSGMDYLRRELKRLGLVTYPSQGNFILVDIGFDCASLYRALLLEGIIIRPCHSFNLPTCIRITVGREDDNRRLIERLSRVLVKLKHQT